MRLRLTPLRWRLLRVPALALLGAWLLALGFSYRLNLHPPRAPLSAIPATYRATAASITFTAADGVRLAGWYYPGLSEGVPGIVVCHGLAVNRSDVAHIAALLQQVGFAVLQFDFRGHGESGDAPVTLGLHEVRDVQAALDELAQRAPGRPLGLYGVSLGACAGLMAAAGDTRVAAVFADSVYADLDTAIRRHLRLAYGRWAPLALPLRHFWQWQFHADPRRVSPRDAVRQRAFPLLLAGGMNDRRMPPADLHAVFAAATGPKELWLVRGAGHAQAYSCATAEYRVRLITFFNRFLLGPA